MSAIDKFMVYSLLVLASLVYVTHAHASPKSRFPRGCEQSAYRFAEGKLQLQNNPDELVQRLYFIRNRGDFRLLLKNETPPNAVVAASWETQVPSGRWAAFAMNKPSVVFLCYRLHHRGRHYEAEPTDCYEKIDVCHYPRVKFAGSNKGVYFVSHGKTLGGTQRDVGAKGILLRR